MKGIYELRAEELKSLVSNLEIKNLEAQNFIKSFRRLLEGERIGKCTRELFSIGVHPWGVDQWSSFRAEFKGVF